MSTWMSEPCPHPARDGRHEVYAEPGGLIHCRACGAPDICTTCKQPLTVPCMTCKGACGATWKHVHDDWMTVYVGNCLRGGESEGPFDLNLDLDADLSILDLDNLD